MKTADAIWMCLPEGMDELFEMVRFERTDKAYDIWLDEKKKLSDEDYRNPNIVARVEKAHAFDPFWHAGFDPSGKIRMTP